jgi:hypothetical protein
VLHQWVKPRCRLVEDQQFRPVHERQHQADLLPVALGQLAHRTIAHHLEPLDELPHYGVVHATAGASEPGNALAASQPGEQFEVAREVSDPAVDLDAVRVGVQSQQGGPALGWPLQRQQQPDRGRLPRPVRAEEPEDLPRLHPQAQVGNCSHGAVSLGQPERLNGARHRATPP